MRSPLTAAILGLGLACAGPAPSPSFAGTAEPVRTLSFGIVPQQSASRLAMMWGPLLDELGGRFGVEFEFKTTKDIPTFEACLASGAYDIAYMNPMHYAIFAEESGYQAIARQADKQLRGVIVTRADAEVSELTRLDGATIAFPSPGAFGASILTRAALTQNGVPFEPAYVKSHDSVYRAVAAGIMPAGGGVTRTLNATAPEVRAQLKVIYETEGFTPHALAAHARLGPAEAERLRNTLMEIAHAAPHLVSAIGMNGFEAGWDADWDDIRALDMPRDATGILEAGEAACPSG